MIKELGYIRVDDTSDIAFLGLDKDEMIADELESKASKPHEPEITTMRCNWWQELFFSGMHRVDGFSGKKVSGSKVSCLAEIPEVKASKLPNHCRNFLALTRGKMRKTFFLRAKMSKPTVRIASQDIFLYFSQAPSHGWGVIKIVE